MSKARFQRRAAYRGRGRHGGQALLMAVLIMVFAALLGATFVTVIAMNLGRTSREQYIADAKDAARSGIRTINTEIVNSPAGEGWRPEMADLPPAPGDPTYNAYYSPFEQAEGWARTVPHPSTSDSRGGDWDGDGTPDTLADEYAELEWYKQQSPTNHVFVKFPDPRQENNGNSPTYLAQVERVPGTASGSTVNGMLQISVIGRSTNSDLAFDSETAYKGTVSNGSPLSYAFYTGNYDTNLSRPVASTLTVKNTPDPTILTLKDNLNLEPGRILILWDGATGATVVVSKVTLPTITVESATGGTVPTFNAGTSVRQASLLMAGMTSMDVTGSGTASTTPGTPLFSAVPTPAPTPLPTPSCRGIYFGGGVHADGQSALTLNTNESVDVPGPVDVPGTSSATVNGTTLTSSSLVRSESGSSTSQVRTIGMPALDNTSFSRYRQATEFSGPGAQYGYGGGLYIDNFQDVESLTNGTSLVDMANFQLQRLWERKPLTDAGDTALTNHYYYQLGDTTYPAASGSLEERGIRGWINPWEYKARGVSIVLQGDTIVVTRDDRSDDPNFLDRPDPNKAWSDSAGILAGTTGSAINSPNVYRMSLDDTTGIRTLGAQGLASTPVYTFTPSPPPGAPAFNGVIFAEGDVRIRGYLGSKDITVVSMGNIYVEGNILRNVANPGTPGSSAKHIALLAKKNVVLNPTGFVSRPAGWQNRDVTVTAMATPAPPAAPGGPIPDAVVSGGASSVTINDASYFRVGDRVKVDNSDNAWHIVTSIDPGANKLNVVPAFNVVPSATSGTPATPNYVHLFTDPPIVDGSLRTDSTTGPPAMTTTTNEFYYDLPSTSETLVRNANFDRTGFESTPLYLSWMSAGQMKKAMDLQATYPGLLPLLHPGTVLIKPSSDGLTVTSAEKTMAGSTALSVPSPDFTMNLLDVEGDGPDGNGVEIMNLVDTMLDSHPPPPDPQPNWEVTIDPGATNVAARRLASTVTSLGGAAIPASSSVPLALTVTQGLYFNHASTANDFFDGSPEYVIGSSSGNATPTPTPTPPAPPPMAPPYFGDDPTSSEYLDTVTELFYWHQGATTTARQQSNLCSLTRKLADGATIQTDLSGNYIGFQGDDSLSLPDYHIGALRVAKTAYTAAGSFTPVQIYVQAAVMAQQGSWFVIPVPMEIKSSANTDINEDGTIDSKDIALCGDMRRPNYHISFLGTIAQNISPTGAIDYDNSTDADGQAVGATKKWLDASSYPGTLVASGGGFAGSNWNTIDYQADPLPDPSTVPNGLMLPVTPDLLYSSA